MLKIWDILKGLIPALNITKAEVIGAAGIAVLLVALGAAGYVAHKISDAHDKGFAAGGEACRAAVSTATAENLKKSQERIIHAQKKTQSAEDKINAAPAADDGPIAPVLRDQLVRMRDAAKGGSFLNGVGRGKPGNP